MKIKLLFLAGFGALATQFGFAQSMRTNMCLTERIAQEMETKFPATKREAMEQQIQAYLSQHKNQRQAGTVIKIPVVIHVVTESGCDGISKAQILNGLETLNNDFRRRNADTVNTRAIFKHVAADTEIEFVLAQKDPFGAKTEGIVRVTSPTAKGTYNRDEVKTAAPAWPTNKYLNIWLVEDIYDAQSGSNILGFSQFPSLPNLNTFGVVLVHSTWGTQGAVPGSTANTNGHYASHEVSHCLNLYHIGEGSIVNGVGLCTDPSGNCSFGDGVLDTPPSQVLNAYTTTCDFTKNTCSNDVTCSTFTTDVPDMIENFQYYSPDNCQNMFTKGQRDRMHQALNFYPHLQNLVSPGNASITGIDPTAIVGGMTGNPVSAFCAPKRVCAGGSISFTDKTYNAPATTYNWTFAGGTPATSTLQNPVVTYNTPGKYAVSLTTCNPEGCSTITAADYITVVPVTNLVSYGPPTYYYEESFEEPTFPVSATANRTWEKATSSTAANPENWTRVNTAFFPSSSGGSNSLRLQTANLPARTVSTLITPNFARTGVPSVVLLDIAYAKKTAQPNDVLKVFYSHDCGVTWNGPTFTLSGNQLITNGGAQVNSFVPSATEWRTETLIQNTFQNNLLTTVFGAAPQVMFKIEATSNGGGTLYIDNFRIGTILGTKEALAAQSIQLFPNPLTAETGIHFELKTPQTGKLKIYDMLGNEVYTGKETTFSVGKHTVSLAEQKLSSGVYMVQLELGGRLFNTKLLVQ